MAVITLDGPSGSGKGTVGQLLAQRLGWHFLDSGAVYRVLALAVLKRSVAVAEVAAIVELARTIEVKFRDALIFLDGEDVTTAIRSEECGLVASRIATYQPVRAALLQLQRDFHRPPGLVADGRDMGTVVFPKAELKIFITASCEERARRRFQQLQERGIRGSLHTILQDLQKRDKRDRERSVAPLRAAADSHTIDTTKLSIDEVVAVILQLADERDLFA